MSPPELEALIATAAEKEADFQMMERAYHDTCAKLKHLREDLLALAVKYHVDVPHDDEEAP